MQLPSPTPLAPSGVKGEGVSRCRMIGLRHFHRRRHQIIGKRAGEKAAVGRVGVFLVERRAERMRKAAGDLAGDHRRDAGCVRNRAW